MTSEFIYELTRMSVDLESFDLAETAIFDEVFRQNRETIRREIERDVVRQINREKRRENAADPARTWAPEVDDESR